MEMIERVARALMRANGGDTESGWDLDWEDYTEDARAAIAAMREPSDQTKRKAWGHPGSDGDGHPNDTAIYQSLIDAALDEA